MRFEKEGYIIPDNAMDGHEIRLDVSVGKGFALYLDTDYPLICGLHKYYLHTFLNGKSVDARQYPNELLPILIRYIDSIWLPNLAPSYFLKRDKKALDYLPKLLGK